MNPEFLPEKLLRYNISTNVYTRPTQVPLNFFCNGFTAKNNGTTQVVVMDDVLDPGESKGYQGNRGEVFDGRLYVKFQTQTPVPATIINSVVITEKFYTNIDLKK